MPSAEKGKDTDQSPFKRAYSDFERDDDEDEKKQAPETFRPSKENPSAKPDKKPEENKNQLPGKIELTKKTEDVTSKAAEPPKITQAASTE